VVLNPVGIRLPPAVDRAAPRSPGPLRVLTVGTIDEHKRQDLAVLALARLREADVDAVLSLVGPETDAAYGSRVRRLVAAEDLADRVDFAGPTADVAARMRCADVLLLPAGEVTPLVLMEAMALGTPVVAANMGSIPEVVVDGVSGLLAGRDDPQAMADAIRRIAIEPNLAAQLAHGARRRAETHCDEALSHDRLRAELERLPADRTHPTLVVSREGAG
jgi:glycosyltransferase involved in cell wall biosynthesis